MDQSCPHCRRIVDVRQSSCPYCYYSFMPPFDPSQLNQPQPGYPQAGRGALPMTKASSSSLKLYLLIFVPIIVVVAGLVIVFIVNRDSDDDRQAAPSGEVSQSVEISDDEDNGRERTESPQNTESQPVDNQVKSSPPAAISSQPDDGRVSDSPPQSQQSQIDIIEEKLSLNCASGSTVDNQIIKEIEGSDEHLSLFGEKAARDYKAATTNILRENPGNVWFCYAKDDPSKLGLRIDLEHKSLIKQYNATTMRVFFKRDPAIITEICAKTDNLSNFEAFFHTGEQGVFTIGDYVMTTGQYDRQGAVFPVPQNLVSKITRPDHLPLRVITSASFCEMQSL